MFRLGLPRGADPYGCPSCGRAVHFCCDNRNCVCWREMKWYERPLREVDPDSDVLSCPYCGHAQHIDWWFERDMERYR